MDRTKIELLDLEPKDIIVTGGFFLPARFPFRSPTPKVSPMSVATDFDGDGDVDIFQ